MTDLELAVNNAMAFAGLGLKMRYYDALAVDRAVQLFIVDLKRNGYEVVKSD